MANSQRHTDLMEKQVARKSTGLECVASAPLGSIDNHDEGMLRSLYIDQQNTEDQPNLPSMQAHVERCYTSTQAASR